MQATMKHRAEDLVQQALSDRLMPLPGYRDLPKDSLHVLTSLAKVRSVSPGERILEEGAKTSHFYIPIDGRLKMTRRLPDGRDGSLALFGPGDAVGTLEQLGGKVSDATVQAMEPCLCLEIHITSLLKALSSQPWLIADLLPVLTRQTLDCRTCSDEMTFHRVELRIAKLFLKLADAFGWPQKEGLFLAIPLTRQELAEMTATSLENVAKILNRWEREEILESHAEGFELRDRETLAFIAGGR